MKKSSLLIKFSAIISISIFFLLVTILNFVVIPKTFNAFSQITCLNQEDNNTCSLIVALNQQQKTMINNHVISIYFIKKQEYKQVLANTWVDNQLIILEANELNSYFNQEVVVTYNYESLLSYLLSNIS